MARSELRRRVDALEGAADPFEGEAIWLVLNPDETTEQGIARWEAEHGPRRANQLAVVWHPIVTGVSRTPDSLVRP